MTHANKRWSFSTGERGRNRVRAFEHPQTGRIFLELYDDAKRKRIALRALGPAARGWHPARADARLWQRWLHPRCRRSLTSTYGK